jgi:hypothetical protein
MRPLDLVDSHGRWKRPCLQTTPECDQLVPSTVLEAAVDTPAVYASDADSAGGQASR